MKKILITLLLYSFCRGAVIVETKNGADPTTNGFTYTANGTPAKGFGTEFGEDYWFVQSTRSIYYLYTAAAANFQDPAGWTVTYRTKTYIENSNAVTDNYLGTRDGTYRYDLSIFGGTTATMQPGAYLLLKTGYVRIDNPEINVEDYHTYQVAFDPNSSLAYYYIDGDLKASHPRSSLYTMAAAELRWGDQNSTTTATHENRYTHVSLETGINPVKWAIFGSPAAVEGGTATYQVKISGLPTAPVTVTINADSQALVNGSSQTQLTFDNTVFPIPAQSVTVTAVDDASLEGEHFASITHSAASQDAAYNFDMRNVVVHITDNDISGIEMNGEQFDMTEGAAEPSVYQIVLKSRPSSDVTISFTTDSQLAAIPSIVFNSSNWDIPQTVSVYVFDDILSEGPHSSIISHTVVSSDADYNDYCIGNVVINITDNEPWCGQPGTMYYNADFNRDCYIDFNDIQGMASVWLMTN